ncbi:hypothetical protein LCGC14_1677630, partial [marine sediment metagenome]
MTKYEGNPIEERLKKLEDNQAKIEKLKEQIIKISIEQNELYADECGIKVVLRELGDKITELEKKVNTQAEKIKGFQFTVNRFLKKNLERIEKLEKELRIWKTEEYTEKENSKRIEKL